jgi:DNA polymerase elongation subunit (family B)
MEFKDRHKDHPNLKIVASVSKAIVNSLYGRVGFKGLAKPYNDPNDPKERKDSEVEFAGFSEAISNGFLTGEIASRGRIKLHQVMMHCHNLGINVLYYDTDSLYLDQPLPEQYLHPTELGKFKLQPSERIIR